MFSKLFAIPVLLNVPSLVCVLVFIQNMTKELNHRMEMLEVSWPLLFLLFCVWWNNENPGYSSGDHTGKVCHHCHAPLKDLFVLRGARAVPLLIKKRLRSSLLQCQKVKAHFKDWWSCNGEQIIYTVVQNCEPALNCSRPLKCLSSSINY